MKVPLDTRQISRIRRFSQEYDKKTCTINKVHREKSKLGQPKYQLRLEQYILFRRIKFHDW